MPTEEQFLNKLGEIPVVHDGFTAAMDYYSRVKDYNTLTKFTLGAAESSLKIAAGISTPVLMRYQPEIDNVNTFACNKLDDIEAKYPLIKQPTEEVKEACVEYVQPVMTKVKPVVTYVNGVVDNTQKMATQIKTSSTNLVSGACDLGINTVSQTVTRTLETTPGRLVTRTLDYALVQTDSLIDKFIPEEEQDAEVDEDSDESTASESQNGHQEVEQMEEMEPSPARVAMHLSRVGTKLRRRLHQRACKDFQSAKVHTFSAISQLQKTLDVRKYAKTNMNGAYTKLDEIWTEINDTEKTEADLDPNGTYAHALEKRIISMGRLITRQIRTGVANIERASTEAGLFVKDPISKSREYKDLVYQFGSEGLAFTFEQAIKSLIVFQRKMRSWIDSVDADWIGIDIDMDGIDLAEDNYEEEEAFNYEHNNFVEATAPVALQA